MKTIQRIQDYICSRSKVLKNLEKKFGKSIEIYQITELSDKVNEYMFRIGKSLNLRVTNTEEGLLIKLLELSIDRKNICRDCEKHDTDMCIKNVLISNENLKMLQIHRKGVESKVMCV
jgi:hypothetical protein